jgi:AcrR family transcriptional regulator
MNPSNRKMKRPRPNEELRISSSKNLPLIEKKHHQIVEGACRVFFEKGYHPTTIRMIARRAACPWGNSYHYIHSKDDVLYLVQTHAEDLVPIKRSNMEKIDDPGEKNDGSPPLHFEI